MWGVDQGIIDVFLAAFEVDSSELVRTKAKMHIGSSLPNGLLTDWGEKLAQFTTKKLEY